MLKVALVHDYIKEYGGAERVLEALHDIWPTAPIYTSVYLPAYLGPHKDRFKTMTIRPSWLQHIPFNAKLISPLRLLAPSVFEHIDLSSFDVIIVSQTGAYFPNLVKKGNAKLICFTHTPPRYLYGYATARDWKQNLMMRILGESANHFLRMTDFEASQNVDAFIANSHEVKSRIRKFYRKNALVIYPPVIQSKNQTVHTKPKKEYYLTGGRLARAKGLDIIIDAFNENGKPLKIFGKGFAGFEEELKQKTKRNIEFVGEVTDRQKLNLMAGAKAYISASIDEDFGITPVEAMSMGTPVVAYKSGGLKETVIEGKTGLFFTKHTAESLNAGLNKFETQRFSAAVCKKQAQVFSEDRFKKEMKLFVTKFVQG